jgi:hypothetical protein
VWKILFFLPFQQGVKELLHLFFSMVLVVPGVSGTGQVAWKRQEKHP